MSKFEIWAELWPSSWLGRVMAKGLVVQTKYLEQGCNTLILFLRAFWLLLSGFNFCWGEN